eukprot:m.364794 g.364794  ORF g.364794 m.364794 type:complete len:69 (-) comp28479_c0_seq1:539-745(-)
MHLVHGSVSINATQHGSSPLCHKTGKVALEKMGWATHSNYSISTRYNAQHTCALTSMKLMKAQHRISE